MILPDAKGKEFTGRTRIFCHVKEFVTPFFVVCAMFLVIWVVVIEVIGTAFPLVVLLMLSKRVVQAAMQFTITVGAVPAISKIKPPGAFNIILPIPMSPVAVSDMIGPVRVVQVPPT